VLPTHIVCSGWNRVMYWNLDIAFLWKELLLLTDENHSDFDQVVITKDSEIVPSQVMFRKKFYLILFYICSLRVQFLMWTEEVADCEDWMVCGVPAAGFCVKLYCCVSRPCKIQHKVFHILWCFHMMGFFLCCFGFGFWFLFPPHDA